VIVIDTSAVVDLLLETPVNDALVARLTTVTEMHVPHLIDVEFLSVLRRLVGRGLLTEPRANVARQRFHQLPLHRYPHHPLGDRVWALRAAITAYDGQFIALAEVLGLPLITSDVKLAGSNGHHATIESFARATTETDEP
jgi:predicted nucleic acid-binding protein